MSDTRQKIMDTAEKCFARHGIPNASIRMIIKEAKVNLGAVTYHFGSKDNLIAEIFKRRAIPINKEREVILNEAQKEAGDQPVSLKRVIEAIIIPQRKATKEYPEFLEFMMRLKNYPMPKFRKLLGTETEKLFNRFDNVFRSALPPMSDYEFHLKKYFLHMMIIVPENDYHFMRFFKDKLSDEDITEVLVSFIEAGLVSKSNAFSDAKVNN